MNCPHCGFNDSKVLDSRESTEGIRRRRECLSCGTRFTTYERIQQSNVFVIKKDKRREPFQKAKVLSGIRKACEKRPISSSMLESLADDIEAEVAGLGKSEVASTEIGDIVMEKLKKLDQVAFIRFASVYRDFADITRLKQEVDNLLKPGDKPAVPSAQLALLPEIEEKQKVPSTKRPRQ